MSIRVDQIVNSFRNGRKSYWLENRGQIGMTSLEPFQGHGAWKQSQKKTDKNKENNNEFLKINNLIQSQLNIIQSIMGDYQNHR